MVITEQIPGDSSGISVTQVVGSDGQIVTPDAWDWIKKGAGVIIDVFGGGGGMTGAPGTTPFAGPAPVQCPPLTVRVGDRCIDPLAAAPGGRPAVTQATGTGMKTVEAVGEGIFGLLSTLPVQVGTINGRPIMRCPIPQLVLAKDNRCYSKKDLPNKLRKWPAHKCKSATDMKLAAIKGAGAAAKSLQAAFKGSGYRISKTGK